jgi:hypothetical protein
LLYAFGRFFCFAMAGAALRALSFREVFALVVEFYIDAECVIDNDAICQRYWEFCQFRSVCRTWCQMHDDIVPDP